MTAHWSLKKLGDIFDIARGGSPRPIENYITTKSDGLNWIKIGDASASGKFIERTKEKIRREGLSKTRLVKPGDFLLTNSMSFGRPYIMATEGCIHDGWLVLKPRVRELVHPDYFYYLLGSDTMFRQFAARAGGSTVKNLNSEIVASVEVRLPPLDEQRRIAAILDKADALRPKRKRAIELLDDLDQTIFFEMFGDPTLNPKGWKSIKLGNLCDVGSSKRVFAREFVEEGVPFYRGTEVGKLGAGERIRPDLHISPDHYESLIQESGKPEIGDLLLPSICQDGRIWRVDTSAPFYFKDGRVLWIKSNAAQISSEYLRNLLKSMFLNNYQSIASGTTFAELKIVNLKNLQIMNPPLKLQTEFSNLISKIQKCQIELSNSENAIAGLFSSLQHRAFSGQL